MRADCCIVVCARSRCACTLDATGGLHGARTLVWLSSHIHSSYLTEKRSTAFVCHEVLQIKHFLRILFYQVEILFFILFFKCFSLNSELYFYVVRT